MEERVEYLEGEMARYVESLEVLSQQFNLMQHFIQIQFGSKFEKFYESQQPENKGGLDEQNISYENETEDCDDDNKDVKIRFCQDLQPPGSEEYGDEDENGSFSTGEIDIYQDEGDEEEETAACPAEMVAVQFEEEADQAVQMNMPARINRFQQNLRNLVPQKVQTQQIQNIQNPSSSSSVSAAVPRRAIRPPPPLLRRPPAGTVISRSNIVSSSSSSNRNSQHVIPRVQRSNHSMNLNARPSLVINHDELQGTGNGKYARYYRKVDAELIQCKICNKVLKRRGKFIQHLRTHTGEKPFCCEYCGASFSRKDNMNVHMTRHHSGPEQQVVGRVSCQLCGDQFWNMIELNTHLHSVHGNIPDPGEEENDFDGQAMYFDEDDEEEEDVLVFNA